MAVLSVEDLHLAFGDRTIFDGEAIAIEPRDRLGIVGANGTGKSTLLRILAKQVEPDAGRVMLSRGCRVGYLPQEHADPGEGGLLESVLASAPGRDGLETRIKDVENALESETDTDRQLELAQSLSDLHAELAHVDSQFGAHRAQSILAGLGFAQSDFQRPLRELSGGWRMRAALASLLYQAPDVLLLDEPTNHLDMPTVAWLSSFLRSFGKALVLTCHDREFLNRHINRVASLEIDGLRTFKGNYDHYLVQRELELEHLEARIKKDEQRKKELEAFVTRFKAKNTKARQAQSKVKMIEKLQERQVELPELRRPVKIEFPPSERAGDTVLTVENVSHSYGDHNVLNDISLQARRGDRIAIVGVNGAGKTTLLRLVSHDMPPSKGDIRLGQNVRPSYFAQHQAEVLGSTNTVLEEIAQSSPATSQTRLRTVCGAFLFSGDDVEKPVGVLSGGEKTRVALARMLVSPGNLLLLDEPTNHLDTESADKLTESLEEFDGTLLFVSHNIDFARRLSNKVWNVKDGGVEEYPGSLADYLDHLAALEEEEAAPVERPASDVVTPKADRKAQKEKERALQNELKKKRSRLSKKIAEIEASIAKRESEQAKIETQLAEPDLHYDDRRKLSEKYDKNKAALEKDMNTWAELEEQLEEVSA